MTAERRGWSDRFATWQLVVALVVVALAGELFLLAWPRLDLSIWIAFAFTVLRLAAFTYLGFVLLQRLGRALIERAEKRAAARGRTARPMARMTPARFRTSVLIVLGIVAVFVAAMTLLGVGPDSRGAMGGLLATAVALPVVLYKLRRWADEDRERD